MKFAEMKKSFIIFFSTKNFDIGKRFFTSFRSVIFHHDSCLVSIKLLKFRRNLHRHPQQKQKGDLNKLCKNHKNGKMKFIEGKL